jgi:hypothetical protein
MIRIMGTGRCRSQVPPPSRFAPPAGKPANPPPRYGAGGPRTANPRTRVAPVRILDAYPR